MNINFWVQKIEGIILQGIFSLLMPITFFCYSINANAMSQGFDFSANEFHGEIDNIDKNHFSVIGGGPFTKIVSSIGEIGVVHICTNYFKQQKQECIEGLVEYKYNPGNSVPIRLTKHAVRINITRPLEIFNSEDVECQSTELPGKYILAIGTWKWSKKPKWRGYADYIAKSWVVDELNMRFLEVPTNTVTCRLNEDRN